MEKVLTLRNNPPPPKKKVLVVELVKRKEEMGSRKGRGGITMRGL